MSAEAKRKDILIDLPRTFQPGPKHCYFVTTLSVTEIMGLYGIYTIGLHFSKTGILVGGDLATFFS